MLSVIMPVLNNIEWTRDCLKSISENTYIPNEIIIIDNGSVDPYHDIKEEFRNLNILFIRNEENIGVNKSWNFGLMLTSKPLVTILNNDTYLNKFFFEKVLKTMEDPNIGICIPIRETTKPRVEMVNKQENPNLIPAKYIEGWAYTIRKEIYNILGPIPEVFNTFMGDTFYFESVEAMGLKIVQMINNTVFHYGSLTVNKTFDSARDVQIKENHIWRGMREKHLNDLKLRFNP